MQAISTANLASTTNALEEKRIHKINKKVSNDTFGFIPVISSGSLMHWLTSRVPTTTRSALS